MEGPGVQDLYASMGHYILMGIYHFIFSFLLNFLSHPLYAVNRHCYFPLCANQET